MGLLGKREVDFELDCGVEATLVYYAVEYPEGLGIDIDEVYYGYGKKQHDMSFLLALKNNEYILSTRRSCDSIYLHVRQACSQDDT